MEDRLAREAFIAVARTSIDNISRSTTASLNKGPKYGT